jgi:hypothetical protein
VEALGVYTSLPLQQLLASHPPRTVRKAGLCVRRLASELLLLKSEVAAACAGSGGDGVVVLKQATQRARAHLSA